MVVSFFRHRASTLFSTQDAQFFSDAPSNKYEASSKQLEATVGYAVADLVGVASPTIGLLVGESVAFVGALVLAVGDGVRWGAFVGLLVGAPVVGLGVGGNVEALVGYEVRDSVGLLVGESVAFVGALVLALGDGVSSGAFVGLLVDASVVGLGVGGIVGAGGGTAPNMSSTSKKCEVSKLPRLGQASFILELGTPNQLAIPRNTASLVYFGG